MGKVQHKKFAGPVVRAQKPSQLNKVKKNVATKQKHSILKRGPVGKVAAISEVIKKPKTNLVSLVNARNVKSTKKAFLKPKSLRNGNAAEEDAESEENIDPEDDTESEDGSELEEEGSEPEEGSEQEEGSESEEGSEPEEDIELEEGSESEEDIELEEGSESEEDIELEEGSESEEDIELEEASESEDDAESEKDTQTEAPAEVKISKTKDAPKEKKEKKVYDPEDPKRTVFVGNLPLSTKPAPLKAFFSKFGEVKSVRFRSPKQEKLGKPITRYAFVVMKSEEAVAKAVAGSGSEFKGQHIRITRVTQSVEDIDSKCVVFVGNLKYKTTDEDLYGIFSTCGEIAYARTLRNERGCKGGAYVNFKKPESVTLALQLKDTLLHDRPIRVERYSKKTVETRLKEKQQRGPEKFKGFKKAPMKGGNTNKQEPEVTGAARRIENKFKGFKKAPMKGGNTNKQEPKQNKKKSEFRGVKVDQKKKPKKMKPSKMMQLAKKIAPKG